jgi:hypothetical protein
VTLTVSPPVRIAAICALVLTVVAGLGLRTLGGGRGGDTSAASTKVLPHHPFGAGAKTTHKSSSVASVIRPKTAKTSTTATVTKPKAKPAPVERKPVVDRAAIKAARDAAQRS